jgi:carboxymethylenebutenolidase
LEQNHRVEWPDRGYGRHMADVINIPSPAGTAEAYLAGAEDPARPGVLFFMDALGLRPQIERMVHRIASWGYVVLAPNVFYRSGSIADLAPHGDLTTPEGRAAFFTPTLKDRINALTPELSNPDTEAWVNALLHHSNGALGVTGYCLGARLAVRSAALYPDHVEAVGGFHGGNLVTEAPDSPHRLVASARAEFAFGHADNDASMSPEAVGRLGEALELAGLPHRNEIYAGAAHGYTMADTSTHDADAAERHFEVLKELFGRRLGTQARTDR